MEFYFLVIFTVLTLILVLIFYSKILKSSSRNYPPGPWGLPLVGFLLHSVIGGESYQEKLLAIKQKYGKVATVRTGSFNCIWLNDYKTIKEAFKNPVFCGRPKINAITSRTHGFVGGIISNDGSDYKEQRRFVVKHLKDLGLGGKLSMENHIIEEIQELISVLEEKCGQLISTRHLFNVPIMNVLWRIITGEKFCHDDPKLIQLAETLNRNMELNGVEKVAFFMPWLTSIFPAAIGWNSYIADATFIFNFWHEYSKSKLKSYRSDVPPQVFIDYYIKAIHDCQDPDSGFYGERGERSLAITIQDLFIAGTETTSTTLTWGLLYLAVFPEVQVKVANEIEAVVGHTSPPTLACRLRMPYTEAFLQELMRHGTLAPLGIPHRASEDTQLCGYFIPKDSIIQANVSAIHNDPALWENPKEFRPERFLDKTLKELIPREGFLPFSYGGRHCIGEPLARDELFLFITSIVQKFRIIPNPGSPVPSLVPLVGVGSIPQAHKLMICHRNMDTQKILPKQYV